MKILKGREGHGRSLAKAVSWRITGTIDTFIISFLVTGKATLAGSNCGYRTDYEDRALGSPQRRGSVSIRLAAFMLLCG